jgi:hypothetical protein
MAEVRRIGLDEVVRHFEEREDPRCSVNRKHPLVSVIVIAVMAVLAGAGGPTAIARWATPPLKEESLVAALDLPNGVPRKDVFHRVLLALRPEAFRACFIGWLGSFRARAVAATGVEQPVLAVDGKTARRSHDRKAGLGALHSVGVWASEFGLSLGQNHESLHRAVIEHIDERLAGDREGAEELTTNDRGHGRCEGRTYLQLPIPKDLPGQGEWKALRTIAVVSSLCLRDGKEGVEVRYYLSSLGMDVKRLARAVRGH